MPLTIVHIEMSRFHNGEESCDTVLCCGPALCILVDMMNLINRKDKDMDEDKELGDKVRGMWHDRAQATKDLYFESDPDTAALRYPYDSRSMQILGTEKWQELFGSDD